MLDQKEVLFSIESFLQSPHKKILLITISQKIEIQQVIHPQLKLTYHYFDMSQAPNVKEAIAHLPVEQSPIFIFDNSKLDNHYLNFHLARWQCKVIIICDSALLHITLDPSIYFAPRTGEKVQRHLLVHLNLAMPTMKFSANRLMSMPKAMEKSPQETSLHEHYLNAEFLADNPITMQMIGDRATDKSFINFLFGFIYASRHARGLNNALANATVALIFARVFIECQINTVAICKNLSLSVSEIIKLADKELKSAGIAEAIPWEFKYETSLDIGYSLAFLYKHHKIDGKVKSLHTLYDSKIKRTAYESQLIAELGGLGRWMPLEILIKPEIKKTNSVQLFEYGMTLWESSAKNKNINNTQQAWRVQNEINGKRITDVQLPLASLIGKCWHERAAARPTVDEAIAWLRVIQGGAQLESNNSPSFSDKAATTASANMQHEGQEDCANLNNKISFS